jgi:hypothetical protein
MSRKAISRRTVIRGIGTAISLPLLDAMVPTLKASTAVEIPKRMLFFMVPNGAHMPAWTPAEEGTDYKLSPILEPLAKHREYVSVFSGLTLDGARDHGDGAGDHARSGAAFLTGAHPKKTDGADIRNGISVDQFAGAAIGNKTRFATLELGTEGSAQSGSCDSGYSCAYSSNLAWRTENSPIAKEHDPASLFERMFGTGEKVSDGKNHAEKAARRKSVLDFALEDAKSLQRQLGVADKRKLDEYLYAIRDVENRLVRSDRLQVGENGVPQYPRPAGIPRDWSEHCKLMMDLTALAIRSDATRILSFMFRNEGNNDGYPDIGVPEGHHDLSHHGKSAEKQEKIQKINTFHMGHFAYLLDHLSGVEEADGTLLDHCMMVYGSGISDGDRHNHDDLPIVFVGKAGGKIRKGGHWRYPKNTPLCNLYLWMLQQSGVETDRFGDSKEPISIPS